MALNLGLNFPKLIPVWLKLNLNYILNLQKSVTEFVKLTEVGEKANFSKFKIASLHNLMLHYKIDISEKLDRQNVLLEGHKCSSLY